jgi:hypothetical protein
MDADSAGWVILTTRYGSDKSMPSEADLARAVDELFVENVESMREPDDAEHPNAWLRYGFDDGPVYVIDARGNGTVTFEKWGDQDDDELLSSYRVYGVDKPRLLSLWKWLASGQVAKIAAEYPECGWKRKWSFRGVFRMAPSGASIELRSAAPNKPKRRIGRWIVLALSLFIVVLVGNSYLKFQQRLNVAKRAFEPLVPFGVHSGGLTSWPLATDRYIWFNKGPPRLTDREADLLLGLASPDMRGKGDFISIALKNTELSDAAVPTLAGLDGINMIDVRGCRITEKGANELRKRMRITRVVGPFPEDGAR